MLGVAPAGAEPDAADHHHLPRDGPSTGHRELRSKHGAVLANLDEQGTRLTTLATRAGIGSSAMGELIDELERLGYVIRRPDPADRRAKLVVPTATGTEVTELAFEAIRRIETSFKRELGREQYTLLRNALKKIAGSAGRSDGRDR